MTNAEYRELLKAGPFPGRIDPWAETGDYFHAIHGDIISHIAQQLQDPLIDLGYAIAKEASLQVLSGGIPDISIKLAQQDEPGESWDYVAAAAGLAVEPGVETHVEPPDMFGLHIVDLESGALVTVIEVVSPTNKVNEAKMEIYRDKRQGMWEQGINIVEIDATRSKKRLFEDVYTIELFSYHTTILINSGRPRIVGSYLGEPLKRFALPLRHEVLPVDPHAAYEAGYRQGSIAQNLELNHRYRQEMLPFPSLIPAGQRETLLEQVAAWREKLTALRGQESAT